MMYDAGLMALILGFGVFVQSAAGFAAGLVIISLMLWSGYSLPEAIAALSVASIPQNLMGVWQLREEIEFKQSVWPAIGRLVFLPVGLIGLVAIQSWPPNAIRQLVGGVVLAITLMIIAVRPKPRERIHPLWAWIAFPVSGWMQGFVGMGGPAMVFWVMAHDWSTKKSRGFLFTMYMSTLVPAWLLMYWRFGKAVIEPSIMAACSIPFLWVATHLGIRVGSWLGRHRLRTVIIILLIAFGVAGLASPWIR